MQAQFLVHLAGDFRVINGEREDFGHIQHEQRGDANFNFAGGDFGIIGAGGTLAHLAGDADDAFAAQRGGAFKKLLGQVGRIENGLRAALAVADINKDQATEVAAGVNPAGQSDRLPDV